MTPKIVAVLVLYGRSAEQSESFVSLRHVLQTLPQLQTELTLLVYDNSPAAQDLPPLPIPASYISDPRNRGLATAYNTGLRTAQESGAAWLLLLDQDTVLTQDYLAELRLTILEASDHVWAIVPKLVHARGVHSPHHLPRLTHTAVPPGFSGVAAGELSAFNSGALMRVSAVERIGGFPARFPMEYLDHAMFHALHAAGGKIWVLRSALAHDLSTMRLGGADSLQRYRRILRAERRFYSQMSTPDRIWYRLRRAKQALGHLAKVNDKRFAWWDLRAALGVLDKADSD